MRAGAVIFTTGFTAWSPGARLTYKAGKHGGKQHLFMVVLLGSVSEDRVETIDPEKFLNALGWFREGPEPSAALDREAPR